MAEGFDKARGTAVLLLTLVLEEHRQMAEVSGEDGPLADLEPAERARAQRLALSVLRHMGRADALLKPLLRSLPGAREWRSSPAVGHTSAQAFT